MQTKSASGKKTQWHRCQNATIMLENSWSLLHVYEVHFFNASQGVCEWACNINAYSSNLICDPPVTSEQAGRNQ